MELHKETYVHIRMLPQSIAYNVSVSLVVESDEDDGGDGDDDDDDKVIHAAAAAISAAGATAGAAADRPFAGKNTQLPFSMHNMWGKLCGAVDICLIGEVHTMIRPNVPLAIKI